MFWVLGCCWVYLCGVVDCWHCVRFVGDGGGCGFVIIACDWWLLLYSALALVGLVGLYWFAVVFCWTSGLVLRLCTVYCC